MVDGRKQRKRFTVFMVAGAVLTTGVLGSVAVAMLGGAISGTNLATGLATAQAKPCQTDPVNFEFVAPAWNGPAKAFTIRQVSYQNVNTSCVSEGARLYLVVSDGNTTFLDTSLVLTASSGSVDLDTPLNSNRAANAEISYLVEN